VLEFISQKADGVTADSSTMKILESEKLEAQPAPVQNSEQKADFDNGDLRKNHPDPDESSHDASSDRTLQASELSYRRLFESARDGILILDADTGRISDVNPFLIEMLGYSHDELVGMPIWELGPFKDIVSNVVKFKQLQRQGYVRYENLPLETRDGRKIAVEFVSNVYQAGDRDVIQCNIRDITERSEAEKERSRIAVIIEYSDEAIISKTVGGIIIGWNRGAEQLYGYNAEEIIGRPISILFPPDEYPEYLKIMKKVRAGTTVESFDTIRQRKDGTLVNVSVGITPVLARESGILGATKHCYDITRIKNLEEQLIEAQKMEVVGHLASGVAHDFNNVLAIIMFCGDLMSAGLDAADPLRKYTDEIQKTAQRGAGLTNQLLIFSRDQVLHPVVLDLNAAAEELSQMLKRLIGENINMTMVAEKEIGHVKADPGHVGQLLMNLVVNARDAMPEGGHLTIATQNVTLDEKYARVHAGTEPGEYVMLSVRDTGIGMTDEVKAHLFNAFFTTKPKGKGTGLGLATCQTIANQCGAHIDVESALNQGSTFKIYFPRIEQPLDSSAKPLVAGPLPRGTETLLIVEDDSSVKDLASDGLELLGYQVLSASNGQDAMGVVRQHQGSPIRLVVTDVIMPVMGGKVMAEWLRAANPDLKFLFTSGYTDDQLMQEGAHNPDIAFLQKPYSQVILARKVRKMLDHRIVEQG
jgi:PAS domain S-box-containing protein